MNSRYFCVPVFFAYIRLVKYISKENVKVKIKRSLAATQSLFFLLTRKPHLFSFVKTALDEIRKINFLTDVNGCSQWWLWWSGLSFDLEADKIICLHSSFPFIMVIVSIWHIYLQTYLINLRYYFSSLAHNINMCFSQMWFYTTTTKRLTY